MRNRWLLLSVSVIAGLSLSASLIPAAAVAGSRTDHARSGHPVPLSHAYGFIAAGQVNACSLQLFPSQSAGTVVCWGDDSAHESDPPNGTASAGFVQLAAGGPQSPAGQEACALNSAGNVSCWGNSILAPSGRLLTNCGPGACISIGSHEGDATPSSFACGIAITGSVRCWYVSNGSLVSKDYTPGSISVGCSSQPCSPFAQVSAAQDGFCAVRVNGAIACRALPSLAAKAPATGTYDQVSVSRAPLVYVPAIPSLGQQTSAAQSGFACAHATDDTVTCWGDGSHGQTSVPAGTFTQVSAGGDFACGISGSSGSPGPIVCWGVDAPPVPPGTFAQVSAGRDFVCGRAPGGAIACSGGNSSGTSQPPGASYSQIAAGTCAVRTPDGSLTCWDRLSQADLPDPPADNTGFVDVSVGQGDNPLACAVDGDGVVSCWDADTPATPNAIVSPSSSAFTAVSAGATAACGLDAFHIVSCFGIAESPNLAKYAQVAVGTGGSEGFACGIGFTNPSGVDCWGDSDINFPSMMPPSSGVYTQVTAGISAACGLRSDGTVTCWGKAASGLVLSGTYSSISLGGGLDSHAANVCGVRTSDLTVQCSDGSSTLGLKPLAGRPFSQVSVGSDDEVCGLDTSGSVSCAQPGVGAAGAVPDKLVPRLQWPQPAPITEGTALSSTQLDATAVDSSNAILSGTFYYSPDVGVVLPEGDGQTLSVTFVPTDTADYLNASLSTTIDVQPSGGGGGGGGGSENCRLYPCLLKPWQRPVT